MECLEQDLAADLGKPASLSEKPERRNALLMRPVINDVYELYLSRLATLTCPLRLPAQERGPRPTDTASLLCTPAISGHP